MSTTFINVFNVNEEYIAYTVIYSNTGTSNSLIN